MKSINLIKNNKIKKCDVGFSISTLFLSFLIPLYRRDFKYFLIQLILLIMSKNFLLLFLTVWLIFSFTYNEIYISNLLKKGYIPYEEKDYELLKELQLNKFHNFIIKTR
jgi:hypothetical protein